jgi:hypothetical protein
MKIRERFGMSRQPPGIRCVFCEKPWRRVVAAAGTSGETEKMPRRDYDLGTGGSGRLGGGPGQGGRLIITGIIVIDSLPALTFTGAVAILEVGQALLACELEEKLVKQEGVGRMVIVRVVLTAKATLDAAELEMDDEGGFWPAAFEGGR